MKDPVQSRTLTMASGSLLSDAAQVEGQMNVGLISPNYTGTKLYLRASRAEAGAYYPVYDKDGAARWSLDTNGTGSAVAVDIADPFVWLKVEADATQMAQRLFYIVNKRSGNW